MFNRTEVPIIDSKLLIEPPLWAKQVTNHLLD